MLMHEWKILCGKDRSETQVQEECERGTREYNQGPHVQDEVFGAPSSMIQAVTFIP